MTPTADRMHALETIRRMHRRAADAGEHDAAANYATALALLRTMSRPRPATRCPPLWNRSPSG